MEIVNGNLPDFLWPGWVRRMHELFHRARQEVPELLGEPLFVRRLWRAGRDLEGNEAACLPRFIRLT